MVITGNPSEDCNRQRVVGFDDWFGESGLGIGALIDLPQCGQKLFAIPDMPGPFGLQVVDECVDDRHCRVQQFADVVFPQSPVDVKSMNDAVPRVDHLLEFRVQGDDPPTDPSSSAEHLAEVHSEPFVKSSLDAVDVLKTVPPDDDILDRCLPFCDGEGRGHLHLACLPLEPFSGCRVEFQQYRERTAQKVLDGSKGKRHEGIVQDALRVHLGERFEIGSDKAFQVRRRIGQGELDGAD